MNTLHPDKAAPSSVPSHSALLWGASDQTEGLIHSTGCSTAEQHPNLNCHSKGYFLIHQNGTQIKAHDLGNAYFV